MLPNSGTNKENFLWAVELLWPVPEGPDLLWDFSLVGEISKWPLYILQIRNNLLPYFWALSKLPLFKFPPREQLLSLS